MQYKWSKDLRARFDDNQALLDKLKTTCEYRGLGKELQTLLQVQFTMLMFVFVHTIRFKCKNGKLQKTTTTTTKQKSYFIKTFTVSRKNRGRGRLGGLDE